MFGVGMVLGLKIASGFRRLARVGLILFSLGILGLAPQTALATARVNLTETPAIEPFWADLDGNGRPDLIRTYKDPTSGRTRIEVLFDGRKKVVATAVGLNDPLSLQVQKTATGRNQLIVTVTGVARFCLNWTGHEFAYDFLDSSQDRPNGLDVQDRRVLSLSSPRPSDPEAWPF